jgi:hypothetical protein
LGDGKRSGKITKRYRGGKRGYFQVSIFKKQQPERIKLTQGAIDFLEGRKNDLTSADVDPGGSEKYGNYERALSLKKAGDLDGASKLLQKSCDPPSIYKGHYCELFKIWRQQNKEDIKKGNHNAVVDRVLKMIQYDDEMIDEMLNYWGKQQKRKLPIDYFDNDRNLKMCDAKALLKASQELNNSELVQKASFLLDKFSDK